MARKTVDIYTVTTRSWKSANNYYLTPESAATQVIAEQEKGDRGLLNHAALSTLIGSLKLNCNKDMLGTVVFKRRAV